MLSKIRNRIIQEGPKGRGREGGGGRVEGNWVH